MDIQPEKCKFQNEEVNALIVAKVTRSGKGKFWRSTYVHVKMDITREKNDMQII